MKEEINFQLKAHDLFTIYAKVGYARAYGYLTDEEYLKFDNVMREVESMLSVCNNFTVNVKISKQ